MDIYFVDYKVDDKWKHSAPIITTDVVWQTIGNLYLASKEIMVRNVRGEIVLHVSDGEILFPKTGIDGGVYKGLRELLKVRAQ